MLLASFALLRMIELRSSGRHLARLLADGGSRVSEPLYPLMVGLHAGLFVSSALEVWLQGRPFLPLLAWFMLGLLGLCLAGRVWIWRSLGAQWNVHIVHTTRPVVDTGPYRYVRHPNYTIVIAEIFALPLVHTAYLTALGFSLLNAGVVWQRIRHEEAVLFTRPDYQPKMGAKPRFLPALPTFPWNRSCCS